jgi:hypothetical protein
VGAFLQRVEEILAVASESAEASADLLIVVDRQGGIQMLDAAGWSLPALQAHFGAAASVFRVEHRGQTVRVEGWEGGQRCLLQRDLCPSNVLNLPGFPAVSHPNPLRALLLAA